MLLTPLDIVATYPLGGDVRLHQISQPSREVFRCFGAGQGLHDFAGAQAPSAMFRGQ